VVFESGGKLWRYEFASGKSVHVDVLIPSDRPNLRARTVDCTPLAGGAVPGPTGKRIALSARGEIFSIPNKDGVTQNLTRTDGVAERSPSWSPDGKWVAFVTDRSGENELAVSAFEASLGIWRSLKDGRGIARELNSLGVALWAGSSGAVGTTTTGHGGRWT